MSSGIWATDNIRDAADSLGVGALSDEAQALFARDVEYRICSVVVEAVKFMRHGKRATLSTQDISQALRVLNVEPLYGYESTRPLRFGEASMGPGQPLFYVEDEEVDFEKLINAPLPKVPREISFTAHWLAVEGVQPSIPQNPASADSRHQELLPKGLGANPNLAAINGHDNVAVKPLVKHILSSEASQLHQRICSALVDETNAEWRHAALNCLETSPALSQLIPYFTEFIAEQVTHHMKDLFILDQMMHATARLLRNPSIYLAPYVSSLVPPVLTCLIGKRLGPSSGSNPLAHYNLRDLAASVLADIVNRFAITAQSLKPRIARTCLKHFLDPNKPLGTHYGALSGLKGVAGADGIRLLVLPNLKVYDSVLKEALQEENKRLDVDKVLDILRRSLREVANAAGPAAHMVNGDYSLPNDDMKNRLVEKVGEVIADDVVKQPILIKTVLESNFDI